MNLTTTLLFYVLFGSAVAVAVYVTHDACGRVQRWYLVTSAVLFWPFYLPSLLQRPAGDAVDSTVVAANEDSAAGAVVSDVMSASIGQVETELDLALTSLAGWSDDVLQREQHRFDELRLAWRAQAEKIRDLDLVLDRLDSMDVVDTSVAVPGDRIASSLRARQANIARLRALRDRLQADLMDTLAWVRELVTMIHLAKYTGAPASRAEDLVMQIATSIEGLAEVATWREAEVDQLQLD